MLGGKLGVGELLIILVIVLVIVGPKQLPKLSKMFGEAVKGFKDGLGDEAEEKKSAENVEESDK